MDHRTLAELEAAVDEVRQSPATDGRVELVVRRPAVDQRELLDEGVLTVEEGLVGDTWAVRRSSRAPERGPNPDAQVTVINARLARLVAGGDDRAPLAGDQLHVDFDLSEANAPAGTRLRVGEAVIEITAKPHTGCQKFSKRFGADALSFVNSPEGRALRLRGVNARVVVPGVVRRGDPVRREDAPA